MVWVKRTKLSLTQNVMPGSENFQCFLESSFLTLFIKTESSYSYGFDAYFLWHHINWCISLSRQDIKWFQDFSEDTPVLKSRL